MIVALFGFLFFLGCFGHKNSVEWINKIFQSDNWLYLIVSSWIFLSIGLITLAHVYFNRQEMKNDMFPWELRLAIRSFPPAQAIIDKRSDILEQYCKTSKPPHRCVLGKVSLLHIAAALNRKKCCKILIQYKINCNNWEELLNDGFYPTDEEGKTPVDWAYKFNHIRLANWLKQGYSSPRFFIKEDILKASAALVCFIIMAICLFCVGQSVGYLCICVLLFILGGLILTE